MKERVSASLYLKLNVKLNPGIRLSRSGTDNSNMTAKVTVADVERVAELANLELEPDESKSMVHDLNAILDYVAQLNELDTAGIVPLAQVSELNGASDPDTLRADANRPSLDRSVVMNGAPETDGAFFKVPKVIER
jgi:aspartyl-tRNA(Asn)/glutamyl-tRNA(Gln) amidotransferase subunit C